MKLTRRQMLRLSTMAGAGMLIPKFALAEEAGLPDDHAQHGGTPATPPIPHADAVGGSRVAGQRPVRGHPALPLPPVLAPVRSDETTDYYEMTISESLAEILPGKLTPIFGYDGIFPGPTIQARRGRRTVVRYTNALREHTTVHLHGGVVAPEHDGQPMDMVHPGESREYVYENDQPSATLWYHDHAMDETGRHCYLGLCGFYLIADEAEEALPLPKGEYDIPLAICDRRFTADGAFDYPAITDDVLMYGALGDTVLVNGAVQPKLEVAARRYRLRFLNASNARPYELALSSGEAFVQIGSDGGLLPAPVARETIRLDAAERADVVVDFAGYPVGTTVVLRNLLGAGGTSEVMRFEVTREAADESSVPAELRPIERLDPADAVVEREIEFGFDAERGLWLLNGLPYEDGRIDFRPQRGTTEIWRISNGAPHDHRREGDVSDPGRDFVHPFHVHGAFFQVLDRNGEPPPAHELGWKDTVAVQPLEAVRILIRFDRHPGVFMFHCHKLEHEDRGMMGLFEVVG